MVSGGVAPAAPPNSKSRSTAGPWEEFFCCQSCTKACPKSTYHDLHQARSNTSVISRKCRDPGSNRGPSDLQSDALPAELSRPCRLPKIKTVVRMTLAKDRVPKTESHCGLDNIVPFPRVRRPPRTVCPSGLRGWTQVPLARAAWVQIPQLSCYHYRGNLLESSTRTWRNHTTSYTRPETAAGGRTSEARR